MLEFIGHVGNLPFVGALALMIGIALLEGVGAVLGLGFSRLLDTLVPDSLADFDPGLDAGLDGGADAASAAGDAAAGAGIFSSVLGWLCVGRVPLLILLIWFLTVFGLVGLAVQWAMHASLGFLLPGIVAMVPALVVAVPSVRAFGRTFAKWVPKEQTTALSKDTFIGLVAIVLRGEARAGQPAEAKLQDRFGKTHYLLVEPDSEAMRFVEGDEVLLVRRSGNRFWGIPNPHKALSPDG